MRKQQGNTLLELLLVLAVASVIITLAVRYFAVVEMNLQVAKAISRIDVVSRAGYDWLSLAREGDFSKITLEELKNKELIRESESDNPWGGPIKVIAGSNQSHVKIILSDISPAGCENIRHNLQEIAYAQVNRDACQVRRGKKQVTYWGEF